MDVFIATRDACYIVAPQTACPLEVPVILKWLNASFVSVTLSDSLASVHSVH